MEKLFVLYILISICIALFVLPKIFQLLNSDIKVDKNTKKFDSLDNRIDTIERVINKLSGQINKINQTNSISDNTISEIVVITDILKLSQEKMAELYDNHIGFMTFAEYVSMTCGMVKNINFVKANGQPKENYQWTIDIQIIKKMPDSSYVLMPSKTTFRYISDVSYRAVTQVWMPDYIQALATHDEYIPKRIGNIYNTGIELVESVKTRYRIHNDSGYEKYPVIGGCFFPRVVHVDVDAMKESISDTNYTEEEGDDSIELVIQPMPSIPGINTEGESGTCQVEN